ncbi:MAG TPA: hypothetical protein VHC70_03285 [Phycisphaerales bacterium]|jgi:hypothetical protein|nr:hypothetical protein [Phycisphaerales bacterium]
MSTPPSPKSPKSPAPKLPPLGSGNAKKLLSGAGGSIGAGHSTAGGTPLSSLVPGAKKADGKTGEDHSVTAKHNFNTGGGPGHGKNAAKGGSGGGTAVPRRTAPGA